MRTMERQMISGVAPVLTAPGRIGYQSPADRCKELLLVLVDGLDRAMLRPLQYARRLDPLSITALHVAADPDAAARLARLWATLPLTVPLEVVHCPNRDLVACAARNPAAEVSARPAAT